MRSLQLLAAGLLGIVCFAGCSSQPQHVDEIPEHTIIRIKSEVLDEERVIAISLPKSYSDDESQTFPVLYMPDGGIKEDFPHIANTINDLVARKEMAPVILVGVENTDRKRDMTTPTEVEEDKKVGPVLGGAENFRAFFRDELKPKIEQDYRDSGETGIIGESLAGFFIMDCFLEEPAMFDKYVTLSPSLWWNDHAHVRNAEESLKRSEGLGNWLYLACADETDIFPFTDELAETLKEHAPKDLSWTYKPRKDLKHHTIYRSVSPEALKEMFPPESR